MKFGSKSTSGNGILLILTIFLLFFITLALASQNFEVSTDKESYYQNEDIYILISGPGNTEFAIKIINPNDLMISEKRGKTTSSGNSYLKYDGFSALGEYKVRLLVDNNVKAVTTFRIVNPIGVTTTTTTTKLPTTITVTTSLVFPTTPTTTVVTTGDVGGGLGEVDTSHPPPPDSFKEKRFSLRSAKYHFSAEESPEFELKIKNAGISTLTSLKPQAHIEDRSGNSVEIEPEIKKLWNGYKIEIPTQRSIQPGLYKLVVDCEGEKQELWFQWGLVSVNTRKSIYHPNETAEILMVVLDKDGHLVSNADIILKVTNPGGLINYYSTFDGSINELERGIYLTNHTATWEEGNYSLYVIATAEDVTSSIKSHFSVKGFYEFDILREIPVTIDPRKGPFESRIRVISYINATSFILKEYLPVEFEVNNSGGAYINITDNERILSWYNLTNNSIVNYSAQTPLIWPYLYELGPAEILYNSNLFIEARPWLLALDPPDSAQINVSNATGDGTGTLPDDLQQDDNNFYEVDKLKYVQVTDFNVTGFSGTINSVTLYVRYKVKDSKFGGTNYIQYSLDNGTNWNDTDIKPSYGDTSETEYSDILTDVDTWDEIQYLDIYYFNNDWGQAQWVRFDRIWLVVEYTPPSPAFDVWNISVPVGSNVTRGDLVNAFANWTTATTINLAYIEINSTGSFVNYTIPTPYTNNWTNYTLNTTNATQFPSAGLINISRIWARDTYNQWSSTNPPLYFYLWGYASVNDSELDPDKIINGTSTTIRCLVLDSNSSQSIQGYNVSFYNSTSPLGTNLTNATGWAQWTFIDYSLGLENITCNITNQASLYYNASSDNERKEVLDTQPPGADVLDPVITNVTATPSTLGLGFTVTIRANVTDNVAVDTVYVNITYNGTTYSYPMVNVSQDIYEYNYTTWNNGQYSYIIWANDTSENDAQSPIKYFYAYGSVTIDIAVEYDLYSLDENVTLVNLTAQQDSDINYDVWVGDDNTRENNPSTAEIGEVPIETKEPEINVSTATGDGTGTLPDDIQTDNNIYYVVSRNENVQVTAFNLSTLDMTDELNSVTLYARFVVDGDYSGDNYMQFTTNGTDWYNTTIQPGSTHTSETEKHDLLENVTAWTDLQNLDIRFINNDGAAEGPDPVSFDRIWLLVNYTKLTDQRYYIKFDISRIPSNAEILGANLTFTVTSAGAGAQGDIYHANETFNSSTSPSVIFNDGQPSECGESNPIGNFNASTTGTKILDVTTSVNETHSASKNLLAYFLNESGEDQYFEISGSSGSNPPGLTITYRTRSQLSNVGTTNITAQLLMQVQKNVSGTWQVINTTVNETKVINASDILFLDDIWNPDPWNTDSESPGIYRVYAVLTDPDGNVLRNNDNSLMEDFDTFEISFFKNIYAEPNVTGYGQNVTIWADVKGMDNVYANITYPNSSSTLRLMTNVYNNTYKYIFNNTWQWGNYTFFVYANKSTGTNASSSEQRFYIRANTTISMYTVDDSYALYEDVDLTFNSTLNNTGTTNISGYLTMKVQRYSGSTWNNFEPPVINDIFSETRRDIASGGFLNLSAIWNPKGWNTSENPPGLYRVYMKFTSLDVAKLKNDDGSDIEGSYQFQILEANLSVTELIHENNDTYNINEYETGDNIAWINITVNNLNSTAINASITLNVLDPDDDRAGWGPNETKYCGDLPPGGSCEKRFDNSTNGYYIPLDATPGTYNFSWNVTLESETSTTKYNTSNKFIIHHLPSNFSSILTPDRIYRGDSAIYNFTIYNPWGKNLTNVNVTINCPSATGFNCTCALPGQSGLTCNFSQIGAGQTVIASFNVSTNTSTPVDDYSINATVNYTNPGLEFHQWDEQQNKILEVREPRLVLSFYYYPSNMTRGGDTAYINTSVLNNDTSNHTGVWLNYTLQYGWTNVSGAINKTIGTLEPNQTGWNNITVSLNLSAQPGPQPVYVETQSDGGGWDWGTVYVDVYANTLLYVTTNESNPENGSTIKVLAWLRYDNGTPISGEIITFENSTGVIGTNTTNATGWAAILHTLPGGLFGSYPINASYNGSSTLYTRPSENQTIVNTYDKPKITDIRAYPDPQGYGNNVTISVNVTDLDGVETVWANITAANDSTYWLQMFNYTADIYEVNFTYTWSWGQYNYTIWVNDTAGLSETSDQYSFNITADIDIDIRTIKDLYQPAEYVNLTNVTITRNFSITYDTFVTINSTKNDSPSTAGIGGKEYNEYADSETINQGVSVSGTYQATWSEGGGQRQIDENDTNPGGQEDYAIQVNYEFNTTINKSDVTAIYFVTDAWSDEAINISAYNYNTAGYDFLGNVSTSESTQTLTICNSVSSCDAYINSSGSLRIRYSDYDKTDNAKTRLYIDFQKIVIENDQRYYVKFDISRIPSNAILIGANLTFTATSAEAGAQGDIYHANETFNGSTPASVIFNDGQPSECGESNPIGNFSAASTGTKVVDVTTSVNETHSANKSLLAYFLNESGEDQYFEISGSSGANPPVLTVSYEIRSQASNYGSAGTNFYLTMKVQKKDGTWTDVPGGLIVAKEPNNISSGNYLFLDDKWNNISWYTDKEDPGLYRAYVELTDSAENILKNSDGSYMTGYYEFNISKPPSIIQLSNIRVYDVTNALDKKTNTSDLIGSGTNTTFNLYTTKTYRVEFVLWNNDTSIEDWNISGDILHEYLNETWNITLTNIWYSNETNNFTGGNWSSGIVTWNTSLGGTINIGQNGTFYYILEINTSKSENYPVHFLINHSQFTLGDNSVFNIILTETQPPGLYNSIYGLNDSSIIRGQSILIYARWDEAIDEAKAEYNSTDSTFYNHSISLPPPNLQNWTNHTITTNVSWVLGNHSAKIYAKDLNNNWNDTLQYLTFLVYGQAHITNSSLSNSTIVQGDNTTMRCRVMADNGSPINGYNVSFYNETGFELGWNLTNSTGWASLTFTGNTLGTQEIICYIDDYLEIYFYGDEERRENLTVIEVQSPWYDIVGQNASKIHKGEKILFYARWNDNNELDMAWLESNETGSWQNNSLSNPLSLSGSQDWSNFSVTIPMNSTHGSMGWRIYANDTFNNSNVTPVNTTVIWGWAKVSQSSLNPNPIYENDSTIMSCRVIDTNGSPINAYNVTFYSNETGYMGWNLTNATGWAVWNFTDNTTGLEKITCNITNDTAKYYDASSENSRSEILNTQSAGADIYPPVAVIYALNASWIWKGESILAYAQWNETIGAANITYNLTSPDLEIFTPDTIVGNWTNHTITTNSSWIVGVHFVKINASDLNGNWNNTLPFLNFTVRGRSKVAWYSPNVSAYRGTVPLRCRVYDKDSGQGIGGYQVGFYNGSWNPLGASNTNDSGIATYNWDGQNDPAGSKTFYCAISNSGYYNTTTDGTDDETTGNFDLLGVLNVTIDNPADGNPYHKGDTLNLNSTTQDENTQEVTPDNATWYNSTSQIATGEDTTWQIPSGHGLGPQVIRVNVTKQYYDSDEDNVTILIWGWSNITWISPDNGNYSPGSIIPLVCRVRDVNSSSGIENYPIHFYYKNSTESGYHDIGINITNSTGHAVYHWDTGGLPLDNYTTLCNITHNSTLYYNVTADNKANTTISLTTPAGRLEVYLMLPPTIPGDGNASLNSGYRVGQNKTFIIKANVTCRNANCGNVQGTIQYNVTALPDTAINTTYNMPFYIVDSPAQNPKNCSTLNVNDSCILNWTINSTGAFGSLWKLDVLFNGTTAQSNNTNYTKIKITKVLILHLSDHTIDWGILDPQITCNASPTNPINVSLDPNSNDADGIYIKGTNLVNGSDFIPVGNVTWGKSNNCLTAKSDGHFLSYSWAEILNSTYAKAGVSQDTYYWIDIPAVPALRYHGYAYIMANATL